MVGSRRHKTGENPEGEDDRHDNLHTDRKTAAAADGGGDGNGGDGKEYGAEVHLTAFYIVMETETENVPHHVAHDNHQSRYIEPDNCHVGKSEEIAAEEAVVMAKHRRGVGIDAARPRPAVDHVMVIPRDDGHDQPTRHDAQYRTERSRLGQKRRPRHHKGV